MVDDPVHGGMIREEGDDLHPAAAAGTDHGVDFVDFPDHLRPAFGRDAAGLLLDDPERRRRQARLPDLPPVGIGVKYAT